MRPIRSEPRPLNSPLFHSQSHRFPISVSRRRRRRLPLAGLRLNAEGSAPAGSTAALHLGQFISSHQTLLPASLGAAADRRLSPRAMGSRLAHARASRLICVVRTRVCGGASRAWAGLFGGRFSHFEWRLFRGWGLNSCFERFA
jgi:hypothetical protein